MSKIIFSNLAHSYIKNEELEAWALKPINSELESGRPYALVGPSGCGKTTILNIISGIIRPKEGQILFDNKDVTKLPVSQRNVAQVFQFPTVYKSMTVFENLAFPLVCRNWKSDKIKERVGQIAEQVGLSSKLNKSANNLGADEKQIVSLGRGLVRDDVSALLMDEPLTVIDPQLKFELRKRIKQIVEGKNITIIYVTHDQYEAMTFADELLVMSQGRLVQRGSPEELFERPNTTYVGNFIGSPAVNILKGIWADGKAKLGSEVLRTSREVNLSSGTPIQLGIRPEYVRLASTNSENILTAQFKGVSDVGNYKILHCEFEGTLINLKIKRETLAPEFGPVQIEFPANKLLVYKEGVLV